MTRCPTCYRPEATDEQWKSGACGKSIDGCSCDLCAATCWGNCDTDDRRYAWTKEPPTEPGWYWIREKDYGIGRELRIGRMVASAYFGPYWTLDGTDWAANTSDMIESDYEFLPVPLEVPE